MPWPDEIVNFMNGLNETLDWQKAYVVNAFRGALRERISAGNGTDTSQFPDVAVGDDVQARSFWAEMQDTVESLVLSGAYGRKKHLVEGHWVDYTGPEYYTGEPRDEFPVWEGADGWETFCKHLGLTDAAGAAWGFRRAVTWPSDWRDPEDPAFTFGKMQTGDIIGPWILADLYMMLNELLWTVHTPEFYYADEEDGEASAAWGYGDGISYAEAINAAYADWIDDEYPHGPAPGPHYALCATSRCVGAQYGYYSQCWRYRGRLSLELWTGRQRDVDFYGCPRLPGDEGFTYRDFDDYGNPQDTAPHAIPFGVDAWNLMITESGTSEATVITSEYLADYSEEPGSSNCPGGDVGEWCRDPGSYDASSIRGWRVGPDDVKAVVRWDVAGGFYYTES